MYYIQLDIRPTGGLTFRRMPGSILHIATYPFLPPSTMSGYLRRLLMLAGGCYPNTTVGNAPYYVLPWPLYHVLGAYPVPRRAYRVHITRRHGPKYQTKHTVFSKLVRVRPGQGGTADRQIPHGGRLPHESPPAADGRNDDSEAAVRGRVCQRLRRQVAPGLMRPAWRP